MFANNYYVILIALLTVSYQFIQGLWAIPDTFYMQIAILCCLLIVFLNKRTFFAISVHTSYTTFHAIHQPLKQIFILFKAANNENESFINNLSNLSHELRTPLIGILGSLELLEKNNPQLDKHNQLSTIRKCSEKLLKTVNQLLNLSALKSDVELQYSPTNIREFISELISSMQPDLKSKGLQINIQLDTNTPKYIMTEQRLLKTVIFNILDNAIKFSSRGEIMFSTQIIDNGAYIIFSITDKGVGIPADKIDSIFDFFALGNKAYSETNGLGVGLYIARRMVEQMSGELNVESSLGKGSRFYFKLPLAEAPAETESSNLNQSANTTCPTNFFKPISVLLVEDNELSQKLIGQSLLQYGFEVTTAANGLECLDRLYQDRFDLILMDIQMPIMNGYETTETIRLNPDWSDIPIIAITANTLPEDEIKALQSGCSAYLAKPFKTEELINEIRIQLQNCNIKKKEKTLPLNNIQLIQDLLPEFFENLSEMLDELNKAIAERDQEAILSCSHSIKGTAGMYGYMNISELAAQLEKAGREKAYNKLPTLFKQLDILYRQAKRVLQEQQAIIS